MTFHSIVPSGTTDVHLSIINNQPTVSSLEIAKAFEKRHDDVLKAIRNLECSANFRLRNFAESSYFNEQNKPQPMYNLTRDGFCFLVMGFTGKRASGFKELFLHEFNRLEATLDIARSLEIKKSILLQKLIPIHGADKALKIVEKLPKLHDAYLQDLILQKDIAKVLQISERTIHRLSRDLGLTPKDVSASLNTQRRLV